MIVSIIMPNYNGGKYIESSILSVVRQTYKNWELIIIDDASGDDSVKCAKRIITKYSNESINLIQLEKNSGTPGVPRNRGLEEAMGDMIAFIDSDDIWHPKKLEIQIEFMQNCNSAFSFTNIMQFNDENKINKYMTNAIESDINHIQYKCIEYKKMLRKCWIKSCSTSMLLKETIGPVRFNPDPKFSAIEDYLFWLEILHKRCRVAYGFDICLTFYRSSTDSISRSKFYMIKQNAKVYKHLFYGKHFKWLLFLFHMATYAYFSIILILTRKAKGQIIK